MIFLQPKSIQKILFLLYNILCNKVILTLVVREPNPVCHRKPYKMSIWHSFVIFREHNLTTK